MLVLSRLQKKQIRGKKYLRLVKKIAEELNIIRVLILGRVAGFPWVSYRVVVFIC